jgi:hypothetical protein
MQKLKIHYSESPVRITQCIAPTRLHDVINFISDVRFNTVRQTIPSAVANNLPDIDLRSVRYMAIAKSL